MPSTYSQFSKVYTHVGALPNLWWLHLLDVDLNSALRFGSAALPEGVEIGFYAEDSLPSNGLEQLLLVIHFGRYHSKNGLSFVVD